MHNLVHLLPFGGPKGLDERLLHFEPLLQSGDRHFELAGLDDGFVIGADEGEIIGAQPKG